MRSATPPNIGYGAYRSDSLLLHLREPLPTWTKPEPDEGALSTVFSVGIRLAFASPVRITDGREKLRRQGAPRDPVKEGCEGGAFRPTRYPFDRKGRREDGLPISPLFGGKTGKRNAQNRQA